MAFWRRAKGEQAAQQPDPELDFLTERQGARLRELAREAFAEAGVEVLPHAQHLEASDGRQFGLWNLAATCAQAPGGEADWPEIVREHVAGAIRSVDAPPLTDLPEHEILAGVFLRVMGTATLPPQWREWYSYARPVAGDLVEVLALDLPDSVTVLRDEDVDRVGEDRLREAGLRNLLAEPIQSYEVAGEPGSGALHIIEGDSYFTASKLITFREVLEATWGRGDLPYGVVLAAPIRHMLLFHPIEGIDVLDGVQRLTSLASSLFGDAPGGVSPFVYWWRDGELTQLSGYDDEGRLQVMVGDELTEVLEVLAARA